MEKLGKLERGQAVPRECGTGTVRIGVLILVPGDVIPGVGGHGTQALGASCDCVSAPFCKSKMISEQNVREQRG